MDDSHESVVKSLNGNYNQICPIDVLGILHIVLMFSLHFIEQFTTTVIWHFSKNFFLYLSVEFFFSILEGDTWVHTFSAPRKLLKRF